jgi:hypothetical protein
MILQSGGANPIFNSLAPDPRAARFVNQPTPPAGAVLNPAEVRNGGPPIHYGYVPRPETPPGAASPA